MHNDTMSVHDCRDGSDVIMCLWYHNESLHRGWRHSDPDKEVRIQPLSPLTPWFASHGLERSSSLWWRWHYRTELSETIPASLRESISFSRLDSVLCSRPYSRPVLTSLLRASVMRCSRRDIRSSHLSPSAARFDCIIIIVRSLLLPSLSTEYWVFNEKNISNVHATE